MGTRGLVGFVVDDTVKASYNHFDSYPNGLGLDVVKFVQGIENVSDVFEKAQALTLVNEDDESGTDWYAELRDVQGDLAGYLGRGVMIDNKAFGYDSLFCEWGYLVNLDNNTVEVYRGFQTDPHSEGRWANFEPDSGYYGIRLIETIPFAELSEDAMSEIEREVYGSED